jgi:hypothetical protein
MLGRALSLRRGRSLAKGASFALGVSHYFATHSVSAVPVVLQRCSSGHLASPPPTFGLSAESAGQSGLGYPRSTGAGSIGDNAVEDLLSRPALALVLL